MINKLTGKKPYKGSHLLSPSSEPATPIPRVLSLPHHPGAIHRGLTPMIPNAITVEPLPSLTPSVSRLRSESSPVLPHLFRISGNGTRRSRSFDQSTPNKVILPTTSSPSLISSQPVPSLQTSAFSLLTSPFYESQSKSSQGVHQVANPLVQSVIASTTSITALSSSDLTLYGSRPNSLPSTDFKLEGILPSTDGSEARFESSLSIVVKSSTMATKETWGSANTIRSDWLNETLQANQD